MAESNTVFGRIDNGQANNASVNVQPGDPVEITFQADGDLDGIIDSLDNIMGGDLKVDADGVGGVDGNTTVSIDGGLTFQTFTFVFVGNFPAKNNTPPAIAGQQILLIQLADGTRVFFFTDQTLQDPATANSVPQGSASISGVDTTPQGVVCFAAGTEIKTLEGLRLIETIKAGDMIQTMDNGFQPVRWIGSRRVAAFGAKAPIRIAAGLYGAVKPLLVSAQHRIMLKGQMAELLFGEPQILVKAKDLVDGDRVTQLEGGSVHYWHMMFDRHEIVFANGSAAESLMPGGTAMDMLDAEARQEIFDIFPELQENGTDWVSARRAVASFEARAFLNSRPLN